MSLLIRDADVITLADPTSSTPERLDLRISDGVITDLGTTLVPRDDDEIIDGRDRLVTPGFVNAHTHSWEVPFKGRYDNMPLELWMLYSYPLLGSGPCSPDFIRARSQLFALENLKSGVTTVVDDVLETPTQDLAQLAAVIDAYDRIGIRANVSGHVINLPFIDTIPYVADRLPGEVTDQIRASSLVTAAEYLDYSRQAMELVQSTGQDRLRYMLAPSAPQRCSADLLAGATEMAMRHNLECHVHLLETKTQLVTGTEFYGRSLPQYLSDIGALSPHTTFAHGIWVDDADIELMATHGVSVSHNPLSNLKLGSGVLPWRRYQEAGVNLGLGTDGWSSSDTPRLLEVIKMASLLHKVADPDPTAWPTVTETLRAGTVGGAASARLADRIGTLEVGKRADVLMWDLKTLNFTPRQRLDHQLVYSENGSSLERVIVDGVIVVEHGRLLTMDEQQIVDEFNAYLPEIHAWQDRTDQLNQVFHPAFAASYAACSHAPSRINRWIDDPAHRTPAPVALR
ncbi:amidohydrolase family protein [Citricoccus sp. NR2]|uniref:amidohydrolase family protein n=1 Tax=Citricoccus sp. NR2 TaxID=3004095 RepID=UPI0022DD3ABF|nr:amidohydrolase family protein [Citricoccus sp. NR2]WBL20084.1 amidohydrolase family protein [Citricoccus sp. NR2]